MKILYLVVIIDMKRIMISSALCLLAASMAHGQPCKQLILDSSQGRILGRYITECVRGHYFIADKGVVKVVRFTHKSGRTAWRVSAILDDSYKENPPTEWAQLNGDIILFYNANTQFSDPDKATVTPDLLSCLDEVIGDRLYIRPPKSNRLIEVQRPGKEPVKIDSRRFGSGIGLNQQIVIFETNGKVTILSSV